MKTYSVTLYETVAHTYHFKADDESEAVAKGLEAFNAMATPVEQTSMGVDIEDANIEEVQS